MTIKITLLLLTTLLITTLVLWGADKQKVPEAGYTVVEKTGAIEIRQYLPCIIAETLIKSDFDEAGNIAFRRLFKYISGNNRKQASIEMTAPVNQEVPSEKIAMTAPVNQHQLDGAFFVSFIMPANYTMATIPEPLDPQIVLKQIPARKIAAITYSGTWGQKKYLKHEAKLLNFIKERNLKAIGAAIFARYNPPFQLWFLRRNEVLIPIE